MSRFEFKEFDQTLGTVIAAEGKPYTTEFDVPMPIGKFYGDVAIELLDIVNEFGAKMDSSAGTVEAIGAFNVLRKNKDFWKRLLPAALGYKDAGGKSKTGEMELFTYFDKYCTNTEIVQVFMEAAAKIVNYSFGGEETEEALAKLEGGAVVEGEVIPFSDGSTQPP